MDIRTGDRERGGAPVGFGLVETGEAEEGRRLAAARALGRLLKAEEIPEPWEETLEHFSVCKGMYNRVVRQDQPDWTVTQVRLGYPSADRCAGIAQALTLCRAAVKKGDPVRWAEARLQTRNHRTRRSLLAYRGRRVLDASAGTGFVYVMSRREDPNLLVVGASARPLLTQAERVNAERPDAPLGVRAFWWVTDVAAASGVLADVMGVAGDDDGPGEYRDNFFRVRDRLGRDLAGEGILMDPFASLVRVEQRALPDGPGAPGA